MFKISPEKARRLKIGTIGAVITAAVIVLVIAFNLAIVLLFGRFPFKLDLTDSKFFGISDDTKKYVTELGSEVELTLLNTEESFVAGGIFHQQVNEVLRTFEGLSQKVKLSYLDPVKNPALKQKYPDRDLETGTIIVSCKEFDRNIFLTPKDYFLTEYDYETYEEYIDSSNAEKAIVSAIINVSSAVLPKFGLLTQHGEEEPATLVNLLKSNGFEFQNVSLFSSEIDPKLDGLIIMAPTNDYTESELKSIDEFLDNEGKLQKTLLYFASVDQPSLPNLEAFLAEWGIAFDEGKAVFETDQNNFYGNNMFYTVAHYTNDLYAEELAASGVPITSFYSRPMRRLFEYDELENITTTELLNLAETSAVYPNDPPEDWDPEQIENKGPFSAAIQSDRVIYIDDNLGNPQPYTSKVIAFASDAFVYAEILNSSNYANSEYLLRMFNSIFEKTNLVAVIPKYIETREMAITAAQVNAIGLIIAVLLPLAVAGTGITVFLRRRHR